MKNVVDTVKLALQDAKYALSTINDELESIQEQIEHRKERKRSLEAAIADYTEFLASQKAI